MSGPVLDRVIWLVFSVGLAILSAVTLAYMEQMAHRAPSVSKGWHSLLNPWWINILRFIYALCIPAVALFAQGALTYRGLGFKPFPWAPMVAGDSDRWRVWLADIETLVFILVFTGLVLAYGLASSGNYRTYPKSNFMTNLLVASRESLLDQVHWAFYRELCVTIWGVALGAWIVMLPLAIELLLNPATWTRMKAVQDRTALLTHCGILFSSTMLYIQTQNVWVMLILEFGLRMLFARVMIPSIRLQRPNDDNAVRVNSVGIA